MVVHVLSGTAGIFLNGRTLIQSVILCAEAVTELLLTQSHHAIAVFAYHPSFHFEVCPQELPDIYHARGNFRYVEKFEYEPDDHAHKVIHALTTFDQSYRPLFIGIWNQSGHGH